MGFTRNLSDELALVSKLDPVSQTAATVTSDAVDMGKARRAAFILSVGVLGASATVDMKLRQGKGSGMTSVKDITGKAITQLTKVGTDDNKQVIVEVRAEELDVQNGFNHVYASVTVGTAACLISLVALAAVERFKPASDFDLATVDEIVTA